MAEVRTKHFRKSSQKALRDEALQKVLPRVIGHFNQAREKAIQDITPVVWEQLRERARSIKTHTMAHLDYYLDLMDRSVRRAGGQVHFAHDAQEANAIVLDIARRHNVRLVVKSKSMVSEEIGVNEALAHAGIESVETDLGEYIIQLAQEPPFHIVAPAMHKTKEQVADLFAKKLHSPRYERIEELCQEARRQLREKFLRAELGLTGANFVVAETGTVVLFTNEGNGRMCTSLPRVHVAVTGMEKLVPAMEDLAVFLRLLPRAATGQRLTSYLTFATGPRRASDEDGPEEFHLVVLDNGRSRLLSDPEMREALNCIRCGACLNVCPVFSKVGGHSYGWVYQGPIGAVVTPFLVGMKQSKDLPFASTLCGSCHQVCPVKINIPHMLLKLRAKSVEGDLHVERSSARAEGLAIRLWYRIVRSPTTFRRLGRLASVLQRPFVNDGHLRRLPLPFFSRWTRKRDFPAVARTSFHQRWREYLRTDESAEEGNDRPYQ